MMITTPKQRMLNAYRGTFSDRYPVAPEFWNYYPARILGVDMIEFEREVPFHLALKTTFEKGARGQVFTFHTQENKRKQGTYR